MRAPRIRSDVGPILSDRLLSARDPHVERDDRTGRFALFYSWRYRGAVAFFVVSASSLLAGAVAIYRNEPGATALAVGIAAPLWLATIYGLYDALAVRIEFDEDGMLVLRWGAGARRIGWNEVERVVYSPIGNWFTFRAGGRSVVRVSVYRSGLATFARLTGEGLRRGPAGKVSSLLFEKAKNS